MLERIRTLDGEEEEIYKGGLCVAQQGCHDWPHLVDVQRVVTAYVHNVKTHHNHAL